MCPRICCFVVAVAVDYFTYVAASSMHHDQSAQTNLKYLASLVPKISKFESGHMTLVMPIWECFVIQWVILTMACLCTEFEDASFSYSTEMKEDPKRKNVDDVE